jgi:hypothetical protein
MNDSAMQLMARERCEQLLATARGRAITAASRSDCALSDHELSRVEARSPARTVLGLRLALVWALVIATAAFVVNVHDGISKIAQSPPTANASEITLRTRSGNGQENVSLNRDIPDGRGMTLTTDAERGAGEVGR